MCVCIKNVIPGILNSLSQDLISWSFKGACPNFPAAQVPLIDWKQHLLSKPLRKALPTKDRRVPCMRRVDSPLLQSVLCDEPVASVHMNSRGSLDFSVDFFPELLENSARTKAGIRQRSASPSPSESKQIRESGVGFGLLCKTAQLEAPKSLGGLIRSLKTISVTFPS